MLAPFPVRARTDEFDLSDVKPSDLKEILKGVRQGKLDQQDRLFRLMLETWPRLAKAVSEIAAAVKSIPMEIHAPIRPGEDEPTSEAARVADIVRRACESYAPRPGFWELGKIEAIDAMLDARPKGVVVLEILWHIQNGIVSPRCFAPVPAKYYGYPRGSSETDRLMLARDGNNWGTLEDFDPQNFVICQWGSGSHHPIHAGLLRPLAKHWLGAVWGLGWMQQFCQLYGIPWRTIETDGTPEAMAKAKQMLESIGASGWAVTGPGVKLTTMDGVNTSSANLPQAALLEICDRACDILMLGQTLTTDASSSGSRALGDVHASVRRDVLQGIAAWVASVWTNQVIPAIVRANFGQIAAEDMPYASMTLPEVKDTKAAAEALKIILESGVPLSKEWAYQHLGIPMPEDDDDLLVVAPAAPMTAPTQPSPTETPDDDEEEEPDLPEIDDLDDDLEDIEAAKAPDLRPTEEMAKNAKQALDVRRSKPASQRGMTAVGIARARDIINRVELSPDTVKRMVSFFARHEGNKSGSTWDDQGKGWQAWQGWGGDAGKAWAERKLAEIERYAADR